MEIWGGPECTIARIGDDWRDQLAETGHRDRDGDIGRIAALGIRKLRYPILWEQVSASDPDNPDFAWTDRRLRSLRDDGIEVIGGLIHHGSGPPGTDLLDPGFAAKLAEHAARAAARYPWIRQWTPVNEPLTTARFSALYGHWYPHRRDYAAFLNAVVNQCAAVRAAMAAIRTVVPDAQLVQTEDLGKTFATPELAYQAEHENLRRWLSLDLLAGHVDTDHPFHGWLVDHGIDPRAIAVFADGTGRPDLIGINHYLTSERFLDHRLHLYPGHPAGGNGRDAYIDAEAVRIAGLEADLGIAARLREAWDRYRIPLAVTEAQHGCTREEQLRWLRDIWEGARQARRDGVDVRAVTLWSLFGQFDWRSLLTRREGAYEPGAFDIRAPAPRPTALARAAERLASGDVLEHPVLDGEGWWRRPGRFYPWTEGKAPGARRERVLLITGATGTLGSAFARIAAHRGLAFHLTDRAELDISDAESVARAIATHRPWAIINAAGFVRVADAAREKEACMAANAAGPRNLAAACAAAGIPLVTFSSDLVFDGLLGRPYQEEDPVSPASVYGASKAEAERHVAAANGAHLVIRTSAFFGAWDQYNFATRLLRSLARGESASACANTVVSPTFVPDLCHASIDLLIDGETGIWHLANQGMLSWHEFGARLAERAGHDPALVAAGRTAPPRNNALTSARALIMRPLEEAIQDYMNDLSETRQSEALIRS